MGFNYSYRPPERNSVKDKIEEVYKKSVGKFLDRKISKQDGFHSGSDQQILKGAVVAVSILILLGLIGVLGTSYTGLATSKMDVEEQLDYKEDQLADIESEKESCENSLFNAIEKVDECEERFENKADDLVKCMKDKNELENYRDELNAFYTECQEEKAESEAKYENALEEIEDIQENYDEFVRNSVRSTCCSINDILNGFIKKFGVSDNQIVCNPDGQYSINCGTGDTNY